MLYKLFNKNINKLFYFLIKLLILNIITISCFNHYHKIKPYQNKLLCLVKKLINHIYFVKYDHSLSHYKMDFIKIDKNILSSN